MFGQWCLGASPLGEPEEYGANTTPYIASVTISVAEGAQVSITAPDTVITITSPTQIEQVTA